MFERCEGIVEPTAMCLEKVATSIADDFETAQERGNKKEAHKIMS